MKIEQPDRNFIITQEDITDSSKVLSLEFDLNDENGLCFHASVSHSEVVRNIPTNLLHEWFDNPSQPLFHLDDVTNESMYIRADSNESILITLIWDTGISTGTGSREESVSLSIPDMVDIMLVVRRWENMLEMYVNEYTQPRKNLFVRMLEHLFNLPLLIVRKLFG